MAGLGRHLVHQRPRLHVLFPANGPRLGPMRLASSRVPFRGLHAEQKSQENDPVDCPQYRENSE